MVYDEHAYPLVRKAVIGDVQPIHEILNAFAAKGRLLPRSLSELYEHLRAYFVLETEPGAPVQGVCGLGICLEGSGGNRIAGRCRGIPGKGAGQEAFGGMFA